MKDKADEIAANIHKIAKDYFMPNGPYMTTMFEERIASELRAYGYELVHSEVEERVRIIEDAHQRCAHKASALVEEAKAEGYAKGVRDAALSCDSLFREKRQCSEKNDGHDDRWCATCEAMEDAYAVAEERILKLLPKEG